MSYPVGPAPDGSFRVGTVRDAQGLNEASVKAIIRGKNLPPWEAAQAAREHNIPDSSYVIGEVGRLDNRIDEIVYGEGLAQLSTYSVSDVWHKPPNCRKIVVNIIGGASGGGRANSATVSDITNHGLGGFSGGWVELEFNPLDLPDQVPVVVGAGGIGSSTDGAYGAGGQPSSFNGIEAGGAGPAAYGTGNKTFRIRGGRGGYRQGTGDAAADVAGAAGGTGSYHDGGRGSTAYGVPGESGQGTEVGQVGMGSGGGGGYPGRSWLLLDHGSGGGGGGWPSGPGGGGGSGFRNIVGNDAHPGNGGSGATGAVFVIAYFETAPTP